MEIFINGHSIFVTKGITVLQACAFSGVTIPRFCYHPRLQLVGNCRICLVEVKGVPKPVVSCRIHVFPAMEIFTERPLVYKSREGAMEFLLRNHPLDCPICDQGGECDLQDQNYLFGRDRRRYYVQKSRVKDYYINFLVHTVITRCIHCTRCTRLSHSIFFQKNDMSLYINGRGNQSRVIKYQQKFSATNQLSGNLIDLCPVGALTKKTYLFRGRPWESKVIESVCILDKEMPGIYLERWDDSKTPVKVRSSGNKWIRDKSRFGYDAFCSVTFNNKTNLNLSIKQISRSSPFSVIGDDLRISDFNRIAFYSAGEIGSQFVYRKNPVTEVTRPNFFCDTLSSGELNNKKAVLVLGNDFPKNSPIIRKNLRSLFLRGTTIFRFGQSKLDFSFVGGQCIKDLVLFVEGKHPFCKYFAQNPDAHIFISTEFWQFVWNKKTLTSIIRELISRFGVSVSFINSNINEVGFNLPAVKRQHSHRKSNHYQVSDIGSKVTSFGYIRKKTQYRLPLFYHCGSWGTGQSYICSPLINQKRALVCTPQGEFKTLVPLAQSFESRNIKSSLSVTKLLSIHYGWKPWNEPRPCFEISSNVFKVRSKKLPFNAMDDFRFNGLVPNQAIQKPITSILEGWVEQRPVVQRFKLSLEALETNIWLFISRKFIHFET